MEAMINTRGRTKLSVFERIYSHSPSCLPPPRTHLRLCFILFSLLFRQFERGGPTVLPVALLITVSSHKTFSLLRMKTSQWGLSLYLVGRMCNYAVPLGPQSHSRAQDVTSCPSVSAGLTPVRLSVPAVVCLQCKARAEEAAFIWKQSERSSHLLGQASPR